MINDKVRMYLLPPLFNAAVRAGASIMNVYKNLDDYDISLKEDKTPITVADRVAHKTIREYLGTTRIPVLSEEGREMRYEERRNWELYWLVDPLDGTVEFIKGNNEFTVNIALMENNVCMGAVIYVPYFEKMYVAGRGGGAFLKERIAPDAAAAFTYDEIVREDEGRIEGNIGRNPRDRMQMTVFPEGDQGKTAVTHYSVLERLGYVTLVKCRLETGRTHQIRVHMKYIGHTLFNDERYGGNEILKGTTSSKYKQFVDNCFAICPRQALHAKTLGFVHPTTGEEMFFDSEIPADMTALIDKWRVYANTKEL